MAPEVSLELKTFRPGGNMNHRMVQAWIFRFSPALAVSFLLMALLVAGCTQSSGPALCKVEAIPADWKMEVSAGEGAEWKAVPVGTVLAEGSQVRLVGDETKTGEALLKFLDGSEMKVNIGSVFTIKKVEPGVGGKLKNLIIDLSKGLSFFRIEPDKERPVTVTTPHAITAVLGTVFSVEVTPERTQAFVYEGTVNFKKTAGDGAWDLQKRQMVHSQASAPTEIAEFFMKDDLWKMKFEDYRKIDWNF